MCRLECFTRQLLWFGLAAGLLGAHLTSQTQAEPARASSRRVVLIVWDGLRPDFVRPDLTPNLARLAENGVFCAAHHPVYISSTEVNGAALATGNYPEHTGILANKEYRPEINWLESSATESLDTIRRGDILSGGRYLAAPTVAETLQAHDIPTAIAGTKPVAIFQNRSLKRTTKASLSSGLVYNGRAIPFSKLIEVIRSNGKDFPAAAVPNSSRDKWTTRALTETLWKAGVPRFSVLWLSEPDASQHHSGLGSTNALAALASSDANLGRVLDALESKGVRQDTDIMVVSDHGFSTTTNQFDAVKTLKKARFDAARKLEDPEPGQILTVGLGGSVLFYVIGHDETVTQKLVKYLQASDFAGVVFTRRPMPGTFTLQQVRMDREGYGPDVLLSLRWSAQTNVFGIPGLLTTDLGTNRTGQHASLSAYDMHNTLVAAGPDFRQGFINEFPTGNADIAPTVLWILGVRPNKPMDGRVLTEILADQPLPSIKPQRTRLQASADLGDIRWSQYLDVSTFQGRVYFDQGNGEAEKD